MSDIAARVGVSQATVSLALNNAPATRISARTRDLVLAAARKLGYEKTVRVPDGGVIGFIIDQLTTSQHLSTLLEGARDEAAANGCLLSVIATQGNSEVEAQAASYLASRSVVGVIYATLITRAVRPASRLRDMPTVLLNCHAVRERYTSILPADMVGGFAATTTLLKAGHRRVAIINGEDWVQALHDRLQGYLQALAQYGIRRDEALIVSGS